MDSDQHSAFGDPPNAPRSVAGTAALWGQTALPILVVLALFLGLTIIALHSAVLDHADVVFRPEPSVRKQRVAVCVHGQLQRLELKSKLENLVVPNVGRVNLSVFLVLVNGSAQFSNGHQAGIPCALPTATPRELVGRLQALQVFGSATFPDRAAHELPFDDEHISRSLPLYRLGSAGRFSRIRKHFSQFMGWESCAQLIATHENRTGSRYDVVMRVRDNSLVMSAFLLDNPELGKGVHVRGCLSSARGYHDKVMIMARTDMEASLRHAHTFARDGDPGATNSESFLKRALDRRNVSVRFMSDEALPVVDGRCAGHVFCPFHRGAMDRPHQMGARKDCLPRQWTESHPACLGMVTALRKRFYQARVASM